MLRVKNPEELEVLKSAVRTYLFRHRGLRTVIRPTFKELVQIVFAVFDRSRVWGDIVYNEDATDKHIETVRHIRSFDGPPQTIGYPQIANADQTNLSDISDELFLEAVIDEYPGAFAIPHIRAMWTLLPVLMLRNTRTKDEFAGYNPEQDILDFVKEYPFFVGEFVESQIESKSEKHSGDQQYTAPNLLAGSRIWLIGTGDDKNNFWESFHRYNIIAIGWEELGDLKHYESERDVQAGLLDINSSTTHRYRAPQIWQFANAIKRGDLVFARYGSKVFGLGIVLTGYQYSRSEQFEGRKFHHFCRVAWINTDPVQLPGQRDWKTNLFTLRELTRESVNYPVFKQVVDRTLSELGLSGVLHVAWDQNEQAPKQGVSTEERPAVHIRSGTTAPSPNYWWFNANKNVWNVEDAAIDQTRIVTSRNENNNKRRIYQNFVDARKGDVVIAYLTTPDKRAVAELVVDRELGNTNEGEGILLRKVSNLDAPVRYDEIKYNEDLSNMQVFKTGQGTLFKLQETEFNAIMAMANPDETDFNNQSETYSIKDELDKLFVDENFIDNCVNNLKRKKNIILQGPPGVGKSYIANKLAWELIGRKDDSKIARVQFHQSFGYEEFIHGYRPAAKGGFALRPGIFLKFVYEAHAKPGTPHVFIIDEINRGNLSRILGECMSTIEHDKRNEEHGVQLLHTAGHEPKFWIPENLYIIGMMNTADRSISLVDYALRRRFAFIDMEPQFESEDFPSLLNVGTDEDKRHIKDSFTSLNKEIEDEPRLGKNYRIGHSYFCTENGLSDGTSFRDWYTEIIEHEIRPLLNSYLPDDEDKVTELLGIIKR